MKKVAFITCVNDEEMYSECLRYIKNLNVPPGFKVETIGIRGAKSLASGYNLGMKSSNAKYKVYLHQDTFIINKNFIYDIIRIFNMDKKIGIIGVIGAKVVPTSGRWFDSQNNAYGKVYENANTYGNEITLLSKKDILRDYENVMLVDGLIIATQYDIPWREDLFDGWHFYDASQCIEFIKRGYQVVIPRQEEPWCVHDCGFVEIDEEYEKYRNVFLDEYSSFLFPTVSILIPAYRPQFFQFAFESACNQTYRNTEIVVLDNSPNEEIKSYIENYLNNNNVSKQITYKKEKPKVEVVDLFNELLTLSNGEYVAFLMDDDMFHKKKLEIMMKYFVDYNDITLVTSHRQPIDENGQILPNINPTMRIFDKEFIIDGKHVIKELMAKSLTNFIGELSVPIFNKSDVELPLGMLNGKQFFANTDMGIWINLLEKGKMVYIPESLTFFRIHSSQDQLRNITKIRGVNELYELLKFFYNRGYYENTFDIEKVLKKFLNEGTFLVRNIKVLDLSQKEKEEYERLIRNIEDALVFLNLILNLGKA